MPDNDLFPKVSIILPTYNRAGYIMEAIDSVCNQTYSDWELWVVDDGSQDNTEELVRQVKDDRIKWHKTIQRLGVTGTRNEGLRKVTGELIAFIDSDDLWNPVKLEKQIEALQQFPEAGLCFTGGYNFRNKGEPVEFFYKQRDGFRYDELFIPFFKSEVSATTPSLMFRRNYLDVIGFFDETKLFADVDFMIRLLGCAKGIILYEPLFYRRLHATNISKGEWEKGSAEGIRLLMSYRHKLPSVIARNALFRAHINFGEKYIIHTRSRKAIVQFLKAWRYKPFSSIPLIKTGKAILAPFRK